LPKHYLVDIRKQVMQTFRKRFQRSRIPKYGSLNKGFTEQELIRFFRVIDSDKFRLLFSYQAQLGLRIGEAVRINVKDIKFESRELVVKTEKAMTLDTLLIPAPLFQAALSFIEEHSEAIERGRKAASSSRKKARAGLRSLTWPRTTCVTGSATMWKKLVFWRSMTRAMSLGQIG
jgi:integrase